MKSRQARQFLTRSAAFGAGFAAASYAAWVGASWLRYGLPARPPAGATDPLLDRLMPVYDVAERHHIDIDAPADIVLAAAADMDLTASPVTRAIFKARELLLRSEPDKAAHPRELVPLVKSLGWGVLADVRGRELIFGAVTQPWLPNVVFRPIAADDFAAFADPDYVKIVWNLRAEPLDDESSTFWTETRSVATSPLAREKFRRYWSFLSPGIVLIRRLSLGPLKADAERRARTANARPAPFATARSA